MRCPVSRKLSWTAFRFWSYQAAFVRISTKRSNCMISISLLARPVSKGQFHVSEGAQIYATLRSACHLARTPAFGPVIVEIPANLLVFRHEFSNSYVAPPTLTPLRPSKEDLERVLSKISISRHPLLYLGVGCASAEADLVALAERLEAPVATTIQGKGVFPESHPLSLWCGFGPMAPPFVRSVTEDCD